MLASKGRMERDTSMDREDRSQLHAMLRVLRRRGWVLVLTVGLLTGAAVGLSVAQQKEYSASASLLFRDPELDQKLFGSTSLSSSTDPQREAATNVTLVSLEVVAERTARALGGV